ncbi:MAG: hypothetical protein M1832_005248 [Thelocarpon impressellum]|nr:MAG: hypothetical protein M1832_005248 [Thelocarpon impressellum]
MAADLLSPLHGACSCGRNRYSIYPSPPGTKASSEARLLFSHAGGHEHHEKEIGPYLRVPLPWYHSTTFSFFPDESHASIRRAYNPHGAPEVLKHFCGFCGSPLTYWSEQPAREKDFVMVALGSLQGLEDGLEAWGLFESAEGDEPKKGEEGEASEEVEFVEKLVKGRRVSQHNVTRLNRDGSVTVEWEVVEWDDEPAMETGAGAGNENGKRKRGDLDGGLREGKAGVHGEPADKADGDEGEAMET